MTADLEQRTAALEARVASLLPPEGVRVTLANLRKNAVYRVAREVDGPHGYLNIGDLLHFVDANDGDMFPFFRRISDDALHCVNIARLDFAAAPAAEPEPTPLQALEAMNAALTRAYGTPEHKDLAADTGNAWRAMQAALRAAGVVL